MTEQLHACMTFGEEFSDDESVNHGNSKYAREDAYVNTAELFNAILKNCKAVRLLFLSVASILFATSVRLHFAGTVGFPWKRTEGLSKIVMQAIPVLEQFEKLFEQAVGTTTKNP